MRALIILGLVLLASCGRHTPPDSDSEGVAHPDYIDSPDAATLVTTVEKITAGSRSSIESARNRAIDTLLHAAGLAKTPKAKQMLGTMAASLKSARIEVPPPGYDLQTCAKEKSVLAFVNSLQPNAIHVCARAAGADQRKLSQVLIHETAHTVGIHDECAATQVEVDTMRAAGGGLSFRNGYMSRCRIR